MGKDTFKGIYAEATVYVPEGREKAYAVLFRKKGLGKKAKVKKA